MFLNVINNEMLWVLFKDNQVVLRNFGCYSGSASVKDGHLGNEDFGESGGYKCESEATDSGPPLISFEVNGPRGAYNMTDSVWILEDLADERDEEDSIANLWT